MKTKIYKTSNFSILNSHYYCLFSLLFFLCSFFSQAQDYEWDWAKSGGGVNKYQLEPQGALNFYNEMITDIVIDDDNNYYFLANLATGNTHVDGNPVTDYSENPNGGMQNVFFSFTCDGTYRWSRPVGGGTTNTYKLTLDNEGGIYLMFSIHNVSLTTPVQFSDEDIRPLYTGNSQEEQEALRRVFLLKYDTDNGDLIWRKDIHGNVSSTNWFHCINDLQIDSNGILHTVVGFKQGVHIDGQLTVPVPEENEYFKYYLLKFDSTDGNLTGTPLLLPMGGGAEHQYMSFRYDENLNRYYIAGSKIYAFLGGHPTEMFFNDVTFGEQNTGSYYCFLISFNPDDFQDWWYKEVVVSDGLEWANQSYINGIEIDSNSDIYINGSYMVGDNVGGTAFFGEYTFPATPYIAHRAFILKMNSQGVVQWSKTPDTQYTVGGGQTLPNSYDIAINGDEVALAGVVGKTQWGDFVIDRPNGHGLDPALVRFDKQTGEVIGLHDIMGYQGGDYYLTAVTADNDGNYVVGGAMRAMLFTDNPNGIATLYNNTSYTDFFFGRLANSACGSANNEVFEQQTLRLYPNPTNGLVYIDAQDLQSYEVYNLLGQKLLSGTNEVINLQELSKGTYIVKARTQTGEVMTSKVIKQ